MTIRSRGADTHSLRQFTQRKLPLFLIAKAGRGSASQSTPQIHMPVASGGFAGAGRTLFDSPELSSRALAGPARGWGRRRAEPVTKLIDRYSAGLDH